MNREAGGPAHLRDRITPHIDSGGRDGTLAFSQSDLSMSASNNQQARIFIIEDDPIMRGMVVDYLEQHNMRAVSASGAARVDPSFRRKRA